VLSAVITDEHAFGQESDRKYPAFGAERGLRFGKWAPRAQQVLNDRCLDLASMRTPCGYDNMSPTTGNIPKANGMFRGVGACCIDDMVIDRSIGHRSRTLAVSC
jgi:hypothetical protein